MNFMKSKAAARNTLAMTAVVLWSSGYVVTRAVVSYFSPTSIPLLRYAVATLILLPYVIIKRVAPPKPRDIGWFIGAGLTGVTLNITFASIGALTVTASVSSLIVSIAPILSAVLAIYAFKERMGWVKWLAFIIAFAGVAVICIGKDGFMVSIGMVWLLLCAFSMAAYFTITKVLTRRGYDAFRITVYSFFIGTVTLLPFLPGALPELFAAPLEQTLSVVYLGMAPSGAAYICWSIAISKAEKLGDVTNFMFMTPVITFFMGYWGLGEMPPITAFLGGALVMAGVLMTNLAKSPEAGEG